MLLPLRLIDIFSRYVVGWMVTDGENSSLASQLIQGTCLKQDVQRKTLTLRSDDECIGAGVLRVA